MSEVQISTAVENPREQGWSELADSARDTAAASSCHGLDAFSSAAGYEFAIASAIAASFSNEPCKYVTASMSGLQIVAAIQKSEQQGWSEVADGARDGAGAASDGHLSVEDQRIWEELKKEYPDVFKDWGGRVKLGRRIAEGGQARIYEAELIDGHPSPLVAKVLKMEGFSLAYLQRQWPLATRLPLEMFSTVFYAG